ncbi:Glycosyl transferase family 2 [Caldanaerobius fijiensis DSM 17918]|uniref:Glucosyl-3-phosphoglycerate synthase n=1 Tax=Caldanaerobius fijiensis DSM 17918 TaxID=1121256 RepID=A0A1M4XIJ0_9THEO|nr:glycosyltransferase [Caldanaerobius fijiensis]SHE93230.1 Glycosyl transferase family 2 [Caldanaerobius fijiensis DSM 17918]
MVSIIIPAYNEENTIENVLKVVVESNAGDEVIVVSDGSTDKTADIARRYAKVIELERNLGKGGAVKKGVEAARGDIILMLDADLIGLTKEHIFDLLRPVLDGEADMTIGLFSSGRFSTDFAQVVAPQLSGQRALKRFIIEDISALDATKYGIEIALTKYARRSRIKVKNVYLKNLTHVMKEEKLGFIPGVKARIKMYWDIIRCISSP